MRKAVFLDRDGLINQGAPPHDYIRRAEDFVFLPNAREAIRALNDAGFLVFVVTNQRGVARGMMTLAEVDRIHRAMLDGLSEIGARIDGVFVCPHDVGACECRKPDIGLFLEAERLYPVDRARSWMVGDSPSDSEAGRRYGVRTIVTGDLMKAAEIILADDDGVEALSSERMTINGDGLS